ncbi:hypothetical protein [Paraburkholderia sp. SIMBA_054]|uniref:hypothetical protein n=1 Tax=Paraburkholderia sp. SIMBA_054 TaxID=3085795 RepID=UPI003978DAE1
MKNMNAREDVNIFFDDSSASYVVELRSVAGWIRHTTCGHIVDAHRSAALALGVPWIDPMFINQTFTVVTDESARLGEYSEQGYEWENSEHTFRELVERLKSDYLHADPSDQTSAPGWLTIPGERDMIDGSVREVSLHPSNERAKRWWPRALAAAGISARQQAQRA